MPRRGPSPSPVRASSDRPGRPSARSGRRGPDPALRGYSPAARPPGRAAYRLGESVADILALLDAAGVGTAHVVGHDWGGEVAWRLGHQHASRVRSLVVLSSPHPAAMAAAMLRSPQALRSSYVAFFQLPWLPERMLPHVLRRALLRSGLPAPAVDRYLRRLAEPGALTAALNWYRALPWSLSSPVGPIPVPTTYACGRADPALGRRRRRTHRTPRRRPLPVRNPQRRPLAARDATGRHRRPGPRRHQRLIGRDGRSGGLIRPCRAGPLASAAELGTTLADLVNGPINWQEGWASAVPACAATSRRPASPPPSPRPDRTFPLGRKVRAWNARAVATPSVLEQY
jgi:pimeloyl-ACP methyl ester carboxylesterase